MKNYFVDFVRVGVEDDATNGFVRRVHNIVKNWETDGSKEISGVSLSSVHVSKDKATFCCSGSYFGKMGECCIMDVFSNGKKEKRYF